MSSLTLRLLFPLVLVAGAVGCTPQSAQPQLAPRASQPTWAIGYADDLQSASKSLSDDRAKARALDDGLPQRLADVKSPTDAQALLAIVKRADDSGRSEAYAARRRQDDAVRDFWDDERGAIAGRAAGAAKSAIAEAKCEGSPDPAPQVAYAVREGVDRALEKRDRQGNDAQTLVDRSKLALGAGNYSAVQKLADDVALASYLVNVALADDQSRAAALLEDRQQASDTLTRAIAEERAFQQEKGRTDAERKGSDDRIAQLQKSQAAIGGAVVSANVAMKNVDEQVRGARDAHTAALTGLEGQIAQRK
jgi:hypothetical protein